MLGQREGDHRLEHRHLDELAAAAGRAFEQRGQHRVGQRQACGLVGDQRRDVLGLAAVVAQQAGQSAGGLDHVVERGLAFVGAALAEARRDAIHQPWVQRRRRLVAQAQALDGGQPHVVHQHVHRRQQPLDHRHAVGLLEVDAQRALVAVDRQEDRAHAARPARHAVGTHAVALGRLDLDHVGAVVAEDLGGHRPQHDGGQVEHSHTGQRTAAWDRLLAHRRSRFGASVVALVPHHACGTLAQTFVAQQTNPIENGRAFLADQELTAMQGLRISPGLLPPECEALRAEVRAISGRRDGRCAGGQARAQLGGLEPRVHAARWRRAAGSA